jgi:dethiobiotin synthetase
LDPTHSIREWAQELALPVIVVARAGLGTMNHTLLTIDSIHQSGLSILGIVLNENGTPADDATRTNPALVAELSRKPVLILEEGSTGLQIPDWLGFLI